MIYWNATLEEALKGNKTERCHPILFPKRAPTRQHSIISIPSIWANPYPEVTGLFCRLPLSTLCYLDTRGF